MLGGEVFVEHFSGVGLLEEFGLLAELLAGGTVEDCFWEELGDGVAGF